MYRTSSVIIVGAYSFRAKQDTSADRCPVLHQCPVRPVVCLPLKVKENVGRVGVFHGLGERSAKCSLRHVPVAFQEEEALNMETSAAAVCVCHLIFR